jgi:hypothetical protein
MRASTAAGLVGAAVLSTIVYPVLGLRLRHDIDESLPSGESAEEAVALGVTQPIG